MTPETLVSKLWLYCHVLRDEGVPVIAYNEQFTQLLFLKMVHERTQAPWNQESPVPVNLSWPTLLERDGVELEQHYWRILDELGKKSGRWVRYSGRPATTFRILLDSSSSSPI